MESRLHDLRVAGSLIRTGTGLLVLGLGAGLVLIIYYLVATQFGHSSASVAAKVLGEVWPWAEPVLDIEGFGIALDGLGLAMLVAQPRLSSNGHRTKDAG